MRGEREWGKEGKKWVYCYVFPTSSRSLSKPRIELIATDGIVQKRLLWIDARPNGVYVSTVNKDGSEDHYSYHADGNTFVTMNGKTQKLVQLQAFSPFKGQQQLASYVLGLGSFPTKVDYKQNKRLRAAVYVDVRNYKSQMIGCNPIWNPIGWTN